MPVPAATRYSVCSDGLRTPIPSYGYQQMKEPYDDEFQMFPQRPPSGFKPLSPSRHNHITQHHQRQVTPAPLNYDSFLDEDYNDFGLGGTDMMIDTLPSISHRAQTVAPSYERQLRYTPQVRSHSQTWGDNGEYYTDDSAGIASQNLYRKSYSIPLTRSGRSGGQWRHIKQALGQTGSNILFIEGTIKDDDVRRFPPFGILEPEMRYNNLGQRMLPRRGSSTARSSSGYKQNQFNSRAKKGFQYWYSEPKANISRKNVGPIGGAKYSAGLPKLTSGSRKTSKSSKANRSAQITQ